MNSDKRINKVKNSILIAVVIAFLMAIIGGTYARFVSRGTAKSSADIAKWHIVLGEAQDISSEIKTLTVPAQDVETNENIAEGKLAPGKTVVATFTVDPTGSEVAVDYLMNVDLSNISGFSNSELEISDLKYILEGTNIEEDMLIDSETGDYIFEEFLSDVLEGKDVTFKLYITWTESTDLERSLADTEKAATLDNILIPVNIIARQHIGDRIAYDYEVEFNANNGIGEMENQSFIYGIRQELKANTYTREGYTFKNWNTESDGTGISYDDKALAKNLAASEKVTLYAQWTPNTYTITYNLNGGMFEDDSITTYTPDTDSFTLNKPSKDGYYFAGWTGSNGEAPQTDVVISKGSIGNKTYTANYAQYSQASLRTFSSGDSNVSWSFNSGTGIYTITQKARSSGWGQGVVCDDSTTNINWGQSYMLEFEIYVPNNYTLKTDGNTMFVSDGEGNDIYGTSWLIVDGVRTDGVGYGKLPQSTAISGGIWHKVQMYLMNNNTTENPDHKAIRSFSGFALDLSSVNSNVTYQMKNLKSIVY